MVGMQLAPPRSEKFYLHRSTREAASGRGCAGPFNGKPEATTVPPTYWL